jgi:hypothetical protein
MVGVERTLTGLETVALPFWVWKISMGLMVGPTLELKSPLVRLLMMSSCLSKLRAGELLFRSQRYYSVVKYIQIYKKFAQFLGSKSV